MSKEGKEIDLLIVIKKILVNKKTLFKYSLLGFIIGLVTIFFIEKKYVATTTFLPSNTSSQSTGSLKSLASFTNVGAGSGGEEFLSPEFYQELIKSPLFLYKLSRSKIMISVAPKKEEITFYDYYDKRKKTLLEKITAFFRSKSKEGNNLNKGTEISNDSIGYISKRDIKIFTWLGKKVEINYNDKAGSVEMLFKMDNKIGAAQMLYSAKSILQELITTFKIRKEEKELNYLERRFKEQFKDFKEKELILAKYRDANIMGLTSKSKIKLATLEYNYSLSRELYTDLAKKVEGQKIKVKSKAPIFTVIKPIVVPNAKTSKFSKKVVMISFIILGFIIGVIKLILELIMEDIKTKLKM